MRRRLVRVLVTFAVVLAGLLAPTTASADGVHNMTELFNSPTGQVNSDMAYWGDRAYQGDYGGFRIFDISAPATPQLLADYRCDGPQNDPVVWENKLLFLAVDRTMESAECGAPRSAAHDDPDGWEGVRIFDVSDPTNIRYIKSVYTDCGAHTITVFPKNPAQLMLYVSSYPLRPGPTCGPDRGPEAGESPLHEKISVIRVPVNNPTAAKVVAEPKVSYPGDPDNLFDPEEHALPGFNKLTGCHDIGVLVERRLAAAACAEQVQLWRIKPNGVPDTQRPLWVFDDNNDTDGAGNYGDVAADFWHTARFTWDGKYVQVDDESFGDGCPTVTPNYMKSGTPADTGRPHMLRASDGTRTSFFTPTRPAESGYCSMHQGNFARVSDKYMSVNAWYMWGVNVIDWSDVGNPQEVAFLDQASDNWAHYWYEGPSLPEPSFTTYGTDGVHTPATGRGFQVFQSGIAADEQKLPFLNPQTQMTTLGPPGQQVRKQKLRTFPSERATARGKRARTRSSKAGFVLRHLAP